MNPDGNRSDPRFASDYRLMIRTFKALPSRPKVFVVLPPPAISQCAETGPAGNATVCLAYNMSYTVINEVYPVLQRQIARDAGADGVVDVWSALNGSTCTAIPPCPECAPGARVPSPPCPSTIDGIHPYPDALAVIAQTVAEAIQASLAAEQQRRDDARRTAAGARARAPPAI